MARLKTLVAAWAGVEAFNHLTIRFAVERACERLRTRAWAGEAGKRGKAAEGGLTSPHRQRGRGLKLDGQIVVGGELHREVECIGTDGAQVVRHEQAFDAAVDDRHREPR
ncbi:hypothetical protein BamIOP4010DRAFT_1140 [Burkholderia ambifaria IOP40-10]|uniref:Uncharacterized protein n=1 Tax=Burkholderia ambifaria IOP40-10 TaxID=396596 RepID=B1FAT1_9BURK|nr:hypothetical protein BamIOP4010DRAFT_1140 [Burkholderia ambifaria IOP40-10]